MNLYNKGTQTSHNIISNTVIDLPLSYREIADLLNDDNLTIGIDKLKVGFHVENMNHNRGDWGSLKQEFGGLKHRSTTGHTRFPLGHAGLSAGCSTRHGQYGWVEFNPSKIINKDGTLVNVARAVEVLFDALVETRNLFKIISNTDQMNILRMDLAVDLAPVSDMQSLLMLAKQSHPIRSVKPVIYENPRTNSVESVSFLSRSTTSVIFYDKSVEQGLRGQVFRMEVQAKKRDLKKIGPATVADISEDAVRTMFRHRGQGFIDLCAITQSSCLEEILRSKTDVNHLLNAAGFEYMALNGRNIPQSVHRVRSSKKFKERFPHRSVKDLL